MGEPKDEATLTLAVSLTIEELALIQGAKVVSDARELEAPIWGFDEELDDFLTDLQASRKASIA